MRAQAEMRSNAEARGTDAERGDAAPLLSRAGLRASLRSRWPEWVALTAFAAIVAILITHHEPWADEAQSWQLARTLPLGELFHSYIRYEVSPGLWHLLLWFLIRGGVSYVGVHWLCGAIATAAAAVLLLRSPLPRVLRIALPFTYFLVFQFAIIARSYVLAPLLLFAIALGWKKSPGWLALWLGLLANLSLHAAALSGGLALVYLLEQWRNGEGRPASGRRRLLLFAGIAAVFYLAALWTAWPPHDLALSRFRGHSRPALIMAFYACRALLWGVCQPWPLSIAFWIGIAAWLRARHGLRFLIPVALFAAFSGAAHVAFWHMGMLTPYVIAVLWILWPGKERGDEGTQRGARWSEAMGMAAMVLLIGTQLAWAGYAAAFDLKHEYSSDGDAAAVLRPLVERGDTVAVTYIDHVEDQDYDAVGILPYFDRDIFSNWEKPFWWWSDDNSAEARFAELLKSRPPVVVVETRQNGPDMPIRMGHPRVAYLEHSGYRLTHTLCGTVPERLELWRTSCHLIFEDAEPQDSRGAATSLTAFPAAK